MARRLRESDSRRDYVVTPAVTRSAARASRGESAYHLYRESCRANRARRVQALRALRTINRSHSITQQATRQRAARAAVLAHRRRSRNSTSHDDSESSIVRDHFLRMRSPRHPTSFHQNPVFKGIRPFNTPIDEEVVNTFSYSDLDDERNYVCMSLLPIPLMERRES